MIGYRNGLDVLAADAETNQAILIRVKNAPELARSQGALASIAQTLAPATTESKIYSAMAKKLTDDFKKQNVDAEVTIVEPTAWKPAGDGHIWQDLAFAVGGAGILALLWALFGGGRK